MPPWASRNLPSRELWASVKAPRRWPKSSLPARDSVRAAQLTSRQGCRCGFRAKMARATSSFPVPGSPVSMMGRSDWAQAGSRARIRRRAGSWVMISDNSGGAGPGLDARPETKGASFLLTNGHLRLVPRAPAAGIGPESAGLLPTATMGNRENLVSWPLFIRYYIL